MKIYVREEDADGLLIQVDADDGLHAVGMVPMVLMRDRSPKAVAEATLRAVTKALEKLDRRRRGEPDIGDLARPKQAQGSVPFACVEMVDEYNKTALLDGSPVEYAWSDLELAW